MGTVDGRALTAFRRATRSASSLRVIASAISRRGVSSRIRARSRTLLSGHPIILANSRTVCLSNSRRNPGFCGRNARRAHHSLRARRWTMRSVAWPIGSHPSGTGSSQSRTTGSRATLELLKFTVGSSNWELDIVSSGKERCQRSGSRGQIRGPFLWRASLRPRFRRRQAACGRKSAPKGAPIGPACKLLGGKDERGRANVDGAIEWSAVRVKQSAARDHGPRSHVVSQAYASRPTGKHRRTLCRYGRRDREGDCQGSRELTVSGRRNDVPCSCAVIGGGQVA